MNINSISLGKNIRLKRKEKGLTLEQLSEICSMSSNFLGNIERGTDIPSLKSLLKICNALNTNTDYFLIDSLNYKASESVQDYQNAITNEIADMSVYQQQKVYDLIMILKNFN